MWSTQSGFIMRTGRRKWRQATSSLKTVITRQSIAYVVVLLCCLSLLSRMKENARVAQSKLDVDKLWMPPHSDGWRQSSAVRVTNWTEPTKRTNGYIVVRCNGGLNQQRSAICNAVLAARIMNATLVLPELDTNTFWHDHSGFSGIYDVPHFIRTLKHDVRIVQRLPTSALFGKRRRRLKAYQLRPPRDAQPSWYETEALATMKRYGAVYLTPFSHRLAEEVDNPEYQRLRCRVNFHALRFREEVMQLSTRIVQRLRSEGHFMAVHLRFEMDMLAFAGCLDIFRPEEQKILREYRKRNFAEKKLEYKERRLIGKCPLTPQEVGLILRAMGFNNGTRIYLAAGDIFGGERFMKPLREMFPYLENRLTVATTEELAAVSSEGRGLLGPAVDYMVCLLSDIFMPTYDGPSNFANNLLGHRLYYGFRTNIRPDRKALAPIFIEREKGWMGSRSFEAAVREVMNETAAFGGPHPRVSPESFYTNPWPECFCKSDSEDDNVRCPSSPVPTFEEYNSTEPVDSDE